MLREITFDSKKVPAFLDGAINTMTLAKKTGIINLFSKCTVTAPIDYTVTGYGTITFNDGAIVVCGRVIYIEAGTTLAVPITTTAGGSIGVKVDLNQNAGSQVTFYSKTTQSLTQQDLNTNKTDGVYEFEIFKYTSNGTTLTLTYQTASIFETNETTLTRIFDGTLKVGSAENADNATNAENAENANIATELFTKSKDVFLSYWVSKTWTGLTDFYGNYIWTDGTNIYYSNENTHYKLNGDTWVSKTWTGLTTFSGNFIWTDGTNIYYSNGNSQYKLNGDTWVSKTWTGLTDFYGNYIWTDGTNIYYSNENTHYKLNGDTWVSKTWTGLTDFYGNYIWTDGIHIYYSNGSSHYKLNGDTWVSKTWTGLTAFSGITIWTDGIHIYYSNGSSHYKLNGDTWVSKTWTELTDFYGSRIWTDGINIYYSYANNHYKLSKKAINAKPTLKRLT